MYGIRGSGLEANFTSRQTASATILYTGKKYLYYFSMFIFTCLYKIVIKTFPFSSLPFLSSPNIISFDYITMIMMRAFYSTTAYYIFYGYLYIMTCTVKEYDDYGDGHTHFPSRPNTPIQTRKRRPKRKRRPFNSRPAFPIGNDNGVCNNVVTTRFRVTNGNRTVV